MDNQGFKAKGLIIIGVLFMASMVLSGCISPNVDNTYRYTGEVTQKSVDGILTALDKAEEVVSTDETFTLIITSPGGSVSAFSGVLDRMNKTPLKTITKIRAYAASAAAMMFSLGDERIMAKEAEIMFHYARFIVGGVHITQRKLEYYIFGLEHKLTEEELKVLETFSPGKANKLLTSIVKANDRLRAVLEAKFSKEVVNKLLIFGKDVYLDGTEALKLGVATSIYDTAYSRKR